MFYFVSFALIILLGKRRARYPEYISVEAVEKGLLVSFPVFYEVSWYLLLQDGTLFRGNLRINAKKRCDAYVTVDGMVTDIFIDGAQARNRAYDGDIVVLFSIFY